ncbi:MAG: hypothetical protein U1F87_12645 [Kiritimatiellia bacterium]
MGIRAIPGLELDSSYEHGPMHFLGYGFNPASAELQEHLAWLTGSRPGSGTSWASSTGWDCG